MPAQDFPNEHVEQDLARARFAMLALYVAAAIHGVGGAYLLFGPGVPGVTPSRVEFFGIISVIQGVLYFLAAAGTFRMVEGATLVGGIVATIGIATTWMTGRTSLILLQIVLTLLIWYGHRAIHQMNQRIASQTQTNKLTEYYHRLLPILMRVMAADGHLDRRQRHKISSLCDTMNLSTYERNYLLRALSGQKVPEDKSSRAPLENLVASYLQSAKHIPRLRPRLALMTAALAVAESDGMLVDEELNELRKIGGLIGWDQKRIDMFIQYHRTPLDPMTRDVALTLLDLAPGASRADIEDAHLALLNEFNDELEGLIGHRVDQRNAERRAIIERAYQCLLPSS